MGGLLAGALAVLVAIVVDVLVDRRRVGGTHAGDGGEGEAVGVVMRGKRQNCLAKRQAALAAPRPRL
jgi:hypothetical protein